MAKGRRSVKKAERISGLLKTLEGRKKGDGSHDVKHEKRKIDLWKEGKRKEREKEEALEKARLEEKWKKYNLIPLPPTPKKIVSFWDNNGESIPAISANGNPELVGRDKKTLDEILTDPAGFVRKEFRNRLHFALYGYGHSCPECAL